MISLVRLTPNRCHNVAFFPRIVSEFFTSKGNMKKFKNFLKTSRELWDYIISADVWAKPKIFHFSQRQRYLSSKSKGPNNVIM